VEALVGAVHEAEISGIGADLVPMLETAGPLSQLKQSQARLTQAMKQGGNNWEELREAIQEARHLV
jgi:hypothetical protein